MKKLILLTIICTLISGCGINEQKAKKWAYENKDKLAEWCADCFPVKPTEIIKGDTIVKLDSIVRVDSVRVQADCPDGTKVDCPPNRIIYKTKHTHSTDTVKVRDTAYETVIENKFREVTIENEALQKQLEDLTAGRNKWRKWFWILSGLIGLGVVAKVYFR